MKIKMQLFGNDVIFRHRVSRCPIIVNNNCRVIWRCKYRDLETWVRGHSKWLEIIPLESLYYSHFIVTIRPCLVSFLPRGAVHKPGLCRRPVSVCPPRSCIASKRVKILKLFSPSGSHTILVFPHQIRWQYSDGNWSVEFRGVKHECNECIPRETMV